ncbi:MAG: hypothetical protein Q9195_005818 [Heterodermia aff. obscurata]
MTSATRDSVVKSIEALLVEAKNLSDDIFEDQKNLRPFQNHIIGLKNDTTAPLERVLGEICCQPHQSTAVMIALEGKWLELLADGKPKTAQDISSATGAEVQLIVRIMRVLTATDVIVEQGYQTYLATPLTQILLDPGWANGLRHFFDHCGPSLINLPSYLKRNGYKIPQDVKTGPFSDAWGGRNTWELYDDEPARGKVFNSFMTKAREGTSMWTNIYPAEVKLCRSCERSNDAVLLVDIGGGRGHVLMDFVKEPSHRVGRSILQDQPAALGDTETLKHQGIEAIAYDFFTPQPIKVAIGHFLYDSLAQLYLHRRQGCLEPEACLPVIHSALSSLKTGLVVLGFALEHKWHYMITAVAWGMYVFGKIITSVGVVAYQLNAYPKEGEEVGAWINLPRTGGGFIVAYFQVRWAAKTGAAACFGTQAAVYAVAVPIVVIPQVWGKHFILEDVGGKSFYLPRSDLSNARLLSKTFAAVATERLFHSIPLWMHSSSLEAITNLSHSSTLRKFVRHIVFSTIQVKDHEDEEVYLSRVKKHLELQTDSLSLVALKYGQHKKAYHAALEDQEYLMEGGLALKILTRAFRGFPNLKQVTIDDDNSQIGYRQLTRDFGDFKAADLFTCDGIETVPELILALSEAGVWLSDLRIGPQKEFDSSCYTQNLFSIFNSISYPKRLCSNAMFMTFCRPEISTHAGRVLQQLRTLEISELVVRDDRSDLLKMARAIKTLVELSHRLESVNIMEISSGYISSDVQQLSVENLFCTIASCYTLRIVSLNYLTITNHQTFVSFVKLHASCLREGYFNSFDLADVK